VRTVFNLKEGQEGGEGRKKGGIREGGERERGRKGEEGGKEEDSLEEDPSGQYFVFIETILPPSQKEE
jgi:hypothetical protein